ncbi:glycoside hydrolase family 16 protein [Cerasicoccus fimbriatus]|uniref:glycoside hydrolase family 16 protein n=1 Tax=Cerasicoccus fimbriatus TaxID=3014554 RepID=UPI0022B3F671|nr:family 16 glycosylhydrolase [Cerasicoccus sp. TK19100]
MRPPSIFKLATLNCALLLLAPFTSFADQPITTKEAQELRASVEAIQAELVRINERLDTVLGAQTESVTEVDLYDNGKKYPPAAKVRIESFDVPVNASVVHVPVTMDKPSPNTVIAYVRVYNGEGGRANPDATKPVIFRPGDPLTKTVSFDVRDMKAGNNLKAVQPSVPDGAYRSGGGILITAKEGAINEPIEGGSEPITFKPYGKLCYEATGETIQYDDKGGPGVFSTSLSHGRTQVGNGETGYYGTVDMGGLIRTPEGLVLSTRRLDTPVEVGSPATAYPFLAVMLSGHKTPDTYFKYGSVEWVAKMPNRFGSWPALWLLPTGGWPPEIDVYEGFGYNGSWKFSSDLSTNLHGGDNLSRTFTRPAMRMKMSTFGLPNTLDTEFHKFAVTVDPEWIIMFVDDIETMRYANPFQGETWYPLTNVAVKAKVDSPYDAGSGDMVLQSLKVWRAE